MAERLTAYAYKCWDCDRVMFAFEKELPRRCPFCQCNDMMRLKDHVEVTVHPVGAKEEV